MRTKNKNYYRVYDVVVQRVSGVEKKLENKMEHQTVCWLLILALGSTVYYKTMTSKPTPKPMSMATMSIVSLSSNFLGVIPFACWWLTGYSFTGLPLNTNEYARIAHRHAISTLIWFSTAMLQIISVLFMKNSGLVGQLSRSLHKNLGMFSMCIVVPIFFVELASNAIFVFLPGKPLLLSVAMGEPSPSPGYFIAMCGCLFSGLAIAPGLLLMYIASLRSLGYIGTQGKEGEQQKGTVRKDLVLHGYHMAAMSSWIIDTGTLRLLIQAGFWFSGCKPFESSVSTVIVQAFGFQSHILLSFIRLSYLFSGLSAVHRQDRWVKNIYTYVYAVIVIGSVSALLVDLPLPSCN